MNKPLRQATLNEFEGFKFIIIQHEQAIREYHAYLNRTDKGRFEQKKLISVSKSKKEAII